MPPPTTELRPMLAEEAGAVLALVMGGLTERWGTYRAELNPDLQDFLQVYRRSLVLVAVREQAIVGAGILHPAGASAQILRMSVARNLRRKGIGTLILRGLLEAAARRGLLRITLETTASWQSAVRFYEQRGFVRTGLIGDDLHFALNISAPTLPGI